MLSRGGPAESRILLSRAIDGQFCGRSMNGCFWPSRAGETGRLVARNLSVTRASRQELRARQEGPLVAGARHSRRSAVRQFKRGDGHASPTKRSSSSDYGGATQALDRSYRSAMRLVAACRQRTRGVRRRSGNRTHRTTRTRGHASCPRAAASMRRSKRLSGSQEPPRATKRLAASMMGPPLLGADPSGSNRSSTRANCWTRTRSTSSRPSPSMSRTENVQCNTRDGLPSTSSTTTLAWRTRRPAKSGTRATSSRRSIRMKAELASACRVSSAESRNNFDDKPTTFALCVNGPMLSLWPPGLKRP